MVSRISDALSRACELPARVLARVLPPAKEAPPRLLPYEWALLLGGTVMLLVPHGLWNNLFGVLYAAAALLLYWCDCARYGKKPLSPGVLSLAVWVFLALCLLSALWAGDRAASLRVALFYFAGFCLAYLAAAAYASAEVRSLAPRLLWLTLMLTALYGFFAYLFLPTPYYVPVGGKILPRLCSTLEHAINYGEFTAMALPLVLVWALTREKKRARGFYSLSLIVPLGALALTYSRTGYVALALALAVLAWSKNPKWLLPLAALAVAAVALAPADIRARILSMLEFSNTASSGRFLLWRECFGIFREHPLLGVGLGTENFYAAYLPFSTGLLDFTPPHSNMGYYEILLSLGLVGFAAFSVFYFGILVRLIRRVRREKGTAARFETAALLASLSGAALANVPEHVWFYPRVLFFWCLIYGAARAHTE